MTQITEMGLEYYRARSLVWRMMLAEGLNPTQVPEAVVKEMVSVLTRPLPPVAHGAIESIMQGLAS